MHALCPIPSLRLWLPMLGLLAVLAFVPAMAVAQPALPPGAGGVDQPEVYTISIGETLFLPLRKQGVRLRVVPSRQGVVDVLPADENNPGVIAVKARALGTVRLTITTEIKEEPATVVQVDVIPDLSYVQNALNRQFPLANVRLASGGQNSVIVSGDVESAEDVDPIVQFLTGYGWRVINNIRVVGVQQVQLEVCVARVDRAELRTMGFNFLAANNAHFLGNTVGPSISQPVAEPIQILPRAGPFGFGTGGQTPPTLIPGTGNLFFGLTTAGSAIYGFLEALRNENLAKDLANPTLVTLSGRPATFLVGGEAPFGTAGAAGISGGGGSGIQFRPFGTRLTFIPVVLADGRIRLEIETELSKVSAVFNTGNILAPQLDINRVHTTVEMGSGETFALCGLIQTEVLSNSQKTPVLGDLPFFGAAWRRVEFREREFEVIILVTPRLADPMDCHQRPFRLPGQETRTPTDFELFLEGILEAPRGSRPLAPDGCYRPAHWWAGKFCDDGVSPPLRVDPLMQCTGQYGPAGCSSCGNGAPQVMPLESRPETTTPSTGAPGTAPATPQGVQGSQPVKRAVYMTTQPAPESKETVMPPQTAPRSSGLQPPAAPTNGVPARIE